MSEQEQELSREQIADDLRRLLDTAPMPSEEAPATGYNLDPTYTMLRRVLTGQCLPVSRRYLRAICEHLESKQ